MKHKIEFPPNRFHLIKFSSNGSLQERDMKNLKEMCAQCSTSMVRTEFSKKFSLGHGLIVASWDRFDESSKVKVYALGIITNRSTTNRKAQWVLVPQIELPRSNRGGKEHWVKPAFEIDSGVASDFQLVEEFEKYKEDLLSFNL